MGLGGADQVHDLPLSIRPALSAESHASQREQALPPVPGLFSQGPCHLWMERELQVSAPDNLEPRDIHNSLLRLWNRQAGKPGLPALSPIEPFSYRAQY